MTTNICFRFCIYLLYSVPSSVFFFFVFISGNIFKLNESDVMTVIKDIKIPSFVYSALLFAKQKNDT